MIRRKSSLPFAILLFIHSILFLFFSVFLCVMYFERRFRNLYESIPSYLILADVCTVIWIVIEYNRLKIGKSGNLNEEANKIASFLLISFFPQCPLVICFGFLVKEANNYSRVFTVISLVLMVLEFVEGGRMLISIVRTQKVKFYRQNS